MPKPSHRLRSVFLYLALALSGGLIVLTLAPFNLWPLGIAGLVIYHRCLLTANLKQSLTRGFFFGLSLYLFGAYWVWVSMHVHGGASDLLSSIMTLGFCAILSFFLITPFAALFYFCKNSVFGQTLGFAALWFLHEWTSTWIFTGFPWLWLGYGHIDSFLSGLAPVTGALGIGFLIALIAALIAVAPAKYRSPSFHLIAAFCLIIAGSAPLLGKHTWVTQAKDTPLTVALVQPNHTLEEKWDYDMQIPIRRFYQNIIPTLKGSDLILWPESAFTEIFQDVPNFLGSLDKLASDQDSALIFGMPTEWQKDRHTIYFNSIHGMGKGSGMYHKQKLVPFGEYVPLEAWLRGLIAFFDLPMSQFSKGPAGQSPLIAKDLIVHPYICYELVYPEFVRKSAARADLLLTVSNDSWFGQSIGPKQHMQMAQMRALENGRYLVRGTNDGITAIVDEKGRITAQLPRLVRDTLKGEVYPMKGLTPYAQYGTLPLLILSVLILLLSAGINVFQPRSHNIR